MMVDGVTVLSSCQAKGMYKEVRIILMMYDKIGSHAIHGF